VPFESALITGDTRLVTKLGQHRGAIWPWSIGVKVVATVGDITPGIPKYPYIMSNMRCICCIMCAGY
jgi:hypothetical protein